MLHSGVSEALCERITFDLQSGDLLILISCDGCKLCLFEDECLDRTIVGRGRFMLSLSDHDVDPGLVSVHGVQHNLRGGTVSVI